MSNPSKIASDVIASEIAGLRALQRSLETDLRDDFARATDIIEKTKNHLIVVGIGKSGHIGRKIAASFASTGTPSFFVHATEANHGDLGMISTGCTILAISNSGESQDLRAVLHYANSLSVPVIGITGNDSSSLAQGSTIILTLPQSPEACPNGLAPTTSTTNALALGDALMVAVMQNRGFTREDFGRRHPGGKLGLQLQSVGDWMSTHRADVPSVIETAKMQDVILAVSGGGKGCVAVLNSQSNMVGMITDGDLRRAMDANFMHHKAADIMANSPLTLSSDMRIVDVIAMFKDNRISNAFVVEDKKPMALIDMKSLLEDGYV